MSVVRITTTGGSMNGRTGVVRITWGGVRGLRGPSGGEATGAKDGTVPTPMLVWVCPHNLHFKPSGMRFTTLDGATEMEPDNVTHISDDVVSVEWLTPRAGIWEFS